MPLVRKTHCPEGAEVRFTVQRSRALSRRRTDAAHSTSVSRMFSIILVFSAMLLFLSPEAAIAARLAGEEQPVTTAPAKTAESKRIQVKTAAPQPLPSVAGRKAASPSPVAPQALSPAASGGASGVPPAAIPERSVAAVPAESAATPASSIPPPVADAAVQKPAETSPVSSPAASPQSGRYVTIDFDNVDISVFIKFVSELTGKNFVIDDKVKGKVTIISPKKIAVEEVYKLFESVLEIYGFATVQAGDVIKVIHALDARGKNVELLLQRGDIAPEDKIVTQILQLQHATPDDMKKVLDPLISKTSVVLAYPPTGMLVITDVLSNIKRLQEIVTALDVEGVGELISYLPLKYASATETAKSMTMIFQQQAVPGRARGVGVISPIKIVADERTNALIILASENDTSRIRELVALIDKEIPRGSGTIRVYYLQNAKAEDLVKVLTGLPQQAKPAAGAPAAGSPTTATAPLSKNVQIVADKATNSLIITADPSDYLVIEDVIRKLDISRPMVYLEGLIMEVNAERGFKLGVEWQGANSASYNGRTGAVIGGVSGEKGSYGIAQGLLANKGLPSGFSFGVIGQMITVATLGGATLTFPNLAAFIQAYQSDSDFRILSTPQLLVLDNEDAEITVGENVPYVSRQDAGVTGVVGTTNYSTYEYRDVGVTLKVTPQINKEGFVRMKLDQTVTKVVSQSASVDAQGSQVLTPTTLKRTAKTTIVVKNGETVVIGGMIQDDSESGTYKVPLLGDIPLLGWLFKSRSNAGKRTNLFVFITPRVIEQPEDARKIKEEKGDYMKTIQEGTIRTLPQKKTEVKERKAGENP